MRDLSKFLPTADMQADFEKFQSLSPEERAMFQEERARKMESMPGEEREAFVDSTREGLRAIKNELQDVKLALELGDVANAISLSYIAKTYFGKSKNWGFLVFLVRFPHFYIAQYYFLGVVNQLQLALILLG